MIMEEYDYRCRCTRCRIQTDCAGCFALNEELEFQGFVAAPTNGQPGGETGQISKEDAK